MKCWWQQVAGNPTKIAALNLPGGKDNKKIFNHNNAKKILKKLDFNKQDYIVATIHRRENIDNPGIFRNIYDFFQESTLPIIFIAGYRTQKRIKEMNLEWRDVNIVDPVGYNEILTLMVNSKGIITDSGTIVEEASVLNIPSIQVRTSTERPQVYDSQSSIKLDPMHEISVEKKRQIYEKLNTLLGKKWNHNLGDGTASQKIFSDLTSRAMTKNGFNMHLPQKYSIDISRSYSNGI
jgi:UDP-N-acetylglucosamine 2-epimerase (non-hydrolysing)